MTPIEHQVLTSVKACLEGSQRPSLGRLAEMVSRSAKQTARYLRKLEEQEYLAPHDAWLRVPTALGMQAIARGPDELSKGPGRPKRGLTRPGFVLLRIYAYGSLEDRRPQNIKLKREMHFVQLSNLRSFLQGIGYLAPGYDEAGRESWCVTEAGIKYLDEMRQVNHPWWTEEGT